MFNPFEGSSEQVRVYFKDLNGEIREDKEYYYYDLIQNINGQEEIVGTVRVPKDTFLVDGKLLYCQEDGFPENSFRKGDAYIQLKVITEDFKKDENGEILPELSEKDYKYINILVKDLLNVPLIEIKVVEEGTGNGISGMTLKTEESEDGKLRTYILTLQKTNFLTDIDIDSGTENISEVIYQIDKIENLNPTEKNFKCKKIKIPTELPNKEPLVFKTLNENNSLEDAGLYIGNKKVEIVIKGEKGTSVKTKIDETNEITDISYIISTNIDISDNLEGGDYISDIKLIEKEDGGLEMEIHKEEFENLIFEWEQEGSKEQFIYSPKEKVFVNLKAGNNIEMEIEKDNSTLQYIFNSIPNVTLEENKEEGNFVIKNIKDNSSNKYEKIFKPEVLEVATPEDIKKIKEEIPSSLPNPEYLTIQFENENIERIEYNGDIPKNIKIKAGDFIELTSTKTNEDQIICEIKSQDTHYEGKNIVSNSKYAMNSTTDIISNENLKLNYIENEQVKSSLSINGYNGIKVEKDQGDIDTIIVDGSGLQNQIDNIQNEGIKNPQQLTLSVKDKNANVLDEIIYKGDTNKNLVLQAGENIIFETNDSDNDFLTCEIKSQDTHYEGKNIISNSLSGSQELDKAIGNGALKINYIENEEVKSSIPVVGEDGITVRKEEGKQSITISAKSIQDNIATGIKNPNPFIFTDGTTSTVYDGENQKQVIVHAGDGIFIKSEQDSNNLASHYTFNSKDTTYKIIVANEDSPLSDTNNSNDIIDNGKLQLRLIQINQIWDEEKQDFVESTSVIKTIPVSGANGTQVYKKNMDDTVYIEGKTYNFKEGLENSNDEISLNFDVDGWIINAQSISHYCVCDTEANNSNKVINATANSFIYENGAMIAVRFSQGNDDAYIDIDFNGKTTSVFQGGSQYKASFSKNTVLWLMYYSSGYNSYWLLVNSPNVSESKNVISKTPIGLTDSNNIDNGSVYLNHINDSSKITSSHLIKGKNGTTVTVEENEIIVESPDITITNEQHEDYINLNYGSVFSLERLEKGANPNEIIKHNFNYKLPDPPTAGGAEHYIAKHILTNSPTGTTSQSKLTGTSTNPIYLNIVDGTETIQNISPIAIYGTGSTNVSTDSYGNLMIGSVQQDYSVATENTLGLIKEGGDISVDDEGIVTVKEAEQIKGDIYIDGLLLQGKDFTIDSQNRKNISSFVWCYTEANEKYKEITLQQSFKALDGLTLNIGFTNTNTAKDPYLRITNNGSTYPIYYNKENISTNLLKANQIYTMIYHGGGFNIIGIDVNSITIIDTTKKPNVGVSYIEHFSIETNLEENTTIYTPIYGNLEDILSNNIEIKGQDIIEVEQTETLNGLESSWVVTHGKKEEGITSTTSRKTLSFDDNFYSVGLKYDEYGHVTDYDSVACKLPTINSGELIDIITNDTKTELSINHKKNDVPHITSRDSLNFGDSFNTMSVAYDDYGHITETTTKTLTLPSLPNIPEQKSYTAGRGLSLRGNQFGHENASIVGGTQGENLKTSLDFGESFNIPQITYDNYGHILDGTKTTTLTLPKETLYTADKGLEITNNVIGHKNIVGRGICGNNAKLNLSYGDAFIIPQIVYDNYGHISSQTKNLSLTLPPIPDYNDIPNTPDIPEQLNIIEGNKIEVVKNENDVTINHEKITKQQGTSSTKSLKFGESFEIETLTPDNYGHIIKGTKATIKLPSIPDYSEIPNTPDIPEQLTIKAGGMITVEQADNNITIGHDIGLVKQVEKEVEKLEFGTDFRISDVYSRDQYGHVTEVEIRTLKMPELPQNLSLTIGSPEDSSKQINYNGSVSKILDVEGENGIKVEKYIQNDQITFFVSEDKPEPYIGSGKLDEGDISDSTVPIASKDFIEDIFKYKNLIISCENYDDKTATYLHGMINISLDLIKALSIDGGLTFPLETITGLNGDVIFKQSIEIIKSSALGIELKGYTYRVSDDVKTESSRTRFGHYSIYAY